jgi:type II secretory pathway pseudopilin PulG
MKVKASTLIESIVSLTIIAIIFSASLITFTSVTGSGNGQRKLIVHQMLQEAVATTKREKRYTEENWSKAGIEFSTQILKENEKGLIHVSITTRDDKGKILETHNEYLLEDEEN